MVFPSQDCQETRDGITEEVLAQVRRAIPQGVRSNVTLDSPLSELGLDSLALMEAINRIEESFSMRFREEWLYDLETCRDLIDCVAANGAKATAPQSLATSPAAIPPQPPAATAIPAEYYDVAKFPECVAFHDRIRATAAAGVTNPFFRVNQQVHTPMAIVDGREVVSYTSFDYLGLAGHAQVAASAKEAIDRFGTSASASRLVGGDHSILRELDETLARFLGTEAATVFPSGYGTNASIFGHLFGAEDLILYDELAHNSIAQGAALSKAGRRSFAHNDYQSLDRLLEDIRGKYRRVIVAIEGVYSMDGDYPDLPRFLEVKRKHGALLYVDEAHSVGVLGATGRGLCEHFGVEPSEGDLWMGTISKALGSCGGYLAGRKALIEYLKYTTPSFVFSTACPPANAAATLSALGVLKAEPERLERLRDRASLFLKLAQDCGLDTGNSQNTPIIPIILGDSLRCIRVSHALLAQGIHAQPILYPAVRESAARVRFFLTAEHTEEQIVRTVQLLADCVAAS